MCDCHEQCVRCTSPRFACHRSALRLGEIWPPLHRCGLWLLLVCESLCSDDWSTARSTKHSTSGTVAARLWSTVDLSTQRRSRVSELFFFSLFGFSFFSLFFFFCLFFSSPPPLTPAAADRHVARLPSGADKCAAKSAPCTRNCRPQLRADARHGNQATSEWHSRRRALFALPCDGIGRVRRGNQCWEQGNSAMKCNRIGRM